MQIEIYLKINPYVGPISFTPVYVLLMAFRSIPRLPKGIHPNCLILTEGIKTDGACLYPFAYSFHSNL